MDKKEKLEVIKRKRPDVAERLARRREIKFT